VSQDHGGDNTNEVCGGNDNSIAPLGVPPPAPPVHGWDDTVSHGSGWTQDLIVALDIVNVQAKPLWDEWSPNNEPKWTASEKRKILGPWPPTSIHDVPFFNTTINTTITVDTTVVEQFIQDIQHNTPAHPMIVGLDTEWRIIGYDEHGKAQHKIALLQLCVGMRCLVFQVHSTTIFIPQVFCKSLTFPAICFIWCK
jgi:hypothetical protein